MTFQFAVLASGSRGNSTLILADGPGLLIDLGLGPRRLGQRLGWVDASPDRLAGVLLTHTHGDHLHRDALGWLHHRRLPLICAEGHRENLLHRAEFRRMERDHLIRYYDDRPFLGPGGLRIEPVPLAHDGGATYGFRIERKSGRRSGTVAIGYVADTGTWTPSTVEALSDVDALGVEFNHDVTLQRTSGRPPYLIARNLGDRGHLSNAQGAALVRAVVGRSRPGAVRDVVLLHLSEQCNRPELALSEARSALRDLGRRIRVHAAQQDRPSPNLFLRPAARRKAPATVAAFPWEVAPAAASPL